MKRAFAALMILGMWLIGMQAYATLPTLPTTFNTDYSLPTGTTYYVDASGSDSGVHYRGTGALQRAIDYVAANMSSGGNIIVVDHNYTDTLLLALPIESNSAWMYVISDSTDGKDIGPDWTALNAATAHAIDGLPSSGVSRIRIRK